MVRTFSHAPHCLRLSTLVVRASTHSIDSNVLILDPSCGVLQLTGKDQRCVSQKKKFKFP